VSRRFCALNLSRATAEDGGGRYPRDARPSGGSAPGEVVITHRGARAAGTLHPLEKQRIIGVQPGESRAPAAPAAPPATGAAPTLGRRPA